MAQKSVHQKGTRLAGEQGAGGRGQGAWSRQGRQGRQGRTSFPPTPLHPYTPTPLHPYTPKKKGASCPFCD
ncbi:MAG: hypothetical protein ACRAVC_25460 [Trichormus sp.]